MMPMIKIGKDLKDIKIGNKQVLKVYKSDKVIWQNREEDELVLHKRDGYYYKINILKPNQAYKFVGSAKYNNDNFSLSVEYGDKYRLRNGDVFSINRNRTIEIRNNSYYDFELFIYKTADEPNLIIKV